MVQSLAVPRFLVRFCLESAGFLDEALFCDFSIDLELERFRIRTIGMFGVTRLSRNMIRYVVRFSGRNSGATWCGWFSWYNQTRFACFQEWHFASFTNCKFLSLLGATDLVIEVFTFSAEVFAISDVVISEAFGLWSYSCTERLYCGVYALNSRALQAQTKRTLLERAYGSAFLMKMDIERQMLSRFKWLHFLYFLIYRRSGIDTVYTGFHNEVWIHALHVFIGFSRF